MQTTDFDKLIAVTNLSALRDVRRLASGYLRSMSQQPTAIGLTYGSEPSDYARCFLVFLAHALTELDTIDREQFSTELRRAVRRQRSTAAIEKKPFRQLLAFTLSALKVLGTLHDDPLADLVKEQTTLRLSDELDRIKCFEGVAGSGNQAMFLAIFLIHARDYLGLNVQPMIDEWVDTHLKAMNRFGFWGPDDGMTHLHFQNGYHQHEILRFLAIKSPLADSSIMAVRALADSQGHFAPYPGGGGCYDYDAVFMLTPDSHPPDKTISDLLMRTASTIGREQRSDGGFADSLYVRPRSAESISMFAGRVYDARRNPRLLSERLRYMLALQRPKNDRIHTHWSAYSRNWSESNLWDSWFRVLALARIDVALFPERAKKWGFIDYPGIGYHHALRQR